MKGCFPGAGANPERYFFIRNFLDSLRNQGIEPGPYNLPVFGYLPEELHCCLDSLFKVNPPTAIFVSEVHIMLAVRDYLARRGIIAPRDVSLICFDHDLSFAWCNPVVSHYTWEAQPLYRRVVRWAKIIAQGKDDRRQTFSMGNFIAGGTIGPVPRDPTGDPCVVLGSGFGDRLMDPKPV